MTAETQYRLATRLGVLKLVPTPARQLTVSGAITIPATGSFALVARFEPALDGRICRMVSMAMTDGHLVPAQSHERAIARVAIKRALPGWLDANPDCFLLAREAEVRWQFKSALENVERAKAAMRAFVEDPAWLAYCARRQAQSDARKAAG